jgi:hypothetical protein
MCSGVLVEHLICNQRVGSSSLSGGTIKSMSYGFLGASVLPLGYKWVTKSKNFAVSSRKNGINSPPPVLSDNTPSRPHPGGTPQIEQLP